MIEGVELKTLTTHADERGFFREVLRASDPILAEGFAQWSHTMSYTGAAKSWHVHLFYIVSEEFDGTDEGRIPHDDPGIGYDWTAWTEVT